MGGDLATLDSVFDATLLGVGAGSDVIHSVSFLSVPPMLARLRKTILALGPVLASTQQRVPGVLTSALSKVLWRLSQLGRSSVD